MLLDIPDVLWRERKDAKGGHCGSLAQSLSSKRTRGTWDLQYSESDLGTEETINHLLIECVFARDYGFNILTFCGELVCRFFPLAWMVEILRIAGRR